MQPLLEHLPICAVKDIAQNIFAGGAWKELRARENSHRKQEQYYKNDVEAWKKDRSAFD